MTDLAMTLDHDKFANIGDNYVRFSWLPPSHPRSSAPNIPRMLFRGNLFLSMKIYLEALNVVESSNLAVFKFGDANTKLLSHLILLPS